jgi:3-oxoacyl-[acyl-carrier protein] reductase
MTMPTLTGRIALVTGASQGIGRACAMELARAGAHVALAARTLDKLEAVAAEITAAGGTAHAFALDVSSEESIKACAKAVIAHFGKVEILVNNAGITRDGLMMRMKRADWDDVLTTNLTGAFLLTQACVSSLLKNRWGRIINITSVVGETGQAGQANYAASKAGLIGLTKSLARELASRNITVNAVAPGFIETPMTHVWGASALTQTSPTPSPSSHQKRPPTSPATRSTSTAACTWRKRHEFGCPTYARQPGSPANEFVRWGGRALMWDSIAKRWPRDARKCPKNYVIQWNPQSQSASPNPRQTSPRWAASSAPTPAFCKTISASSTSACPPTSRK